MVDIHGVAESRLRTGGQRYTTNRRAIVAALDQAPQPVSLPQLLSRHRELAQSSAYRNLAILETAGIVHRIVTGDGFARFELAQGLTDHHHHHRICATCGSVEDFTLPATGGRAATPSSGTVNDGARSVSWSGPAKTASTTTSLGLTQTDVDAACAVPGAYCDDYALTAGLTADYWKTHAGGVTVTVTWALKSDDFDLYIFDPDGNIVANSGQGDTTSEVATVPSAVGPYTVRVLYYGTTNAGYNATAVVDAVATNVSPQTTVPDSAPSTAWRAMASWTLGSKRSPSGE